MIRRCYAGWGNLVYFDTDEHQITHKRGTIAEIPKLGSQWKVIHDFKPTDYRQAADSTRPSVDLGVFTRDGTPGSSFVPIFFLLPKIGLKHGFFNDNNQFQVLTTVDQN